MSDSPMFSFAISKISTQQAGGWKITLDVPQNMEPVVRQLLGTENRIIYRGTFEDLGEIDQSAKRSPGRPRKT